MISVNVTERSVDKAREELAKATEMRKTAENAWWSSPSGDEKLSTYGEYVDALAQERDASAIYDALENARKLQIENVMRRAIYAHAEDLAGLPARYKKTKGLVAGIVADALQVPTSDVSVYEDNTHNLNAYFHGASVTVYGDLFSGDLDDADAIRAWSKPYEDGRDDLTAPKVRRLAVAREKAAADLRAAADAYRDKCRKIISRYKCIGDTDDLRKAAEVAYV